MEENENLSVTQRSSGSLDFHHKLYLLQLLSKVTHTTRK